MFPSINGLILTLRELKEKELDDGLTDEEETYLKTLESSIREFEGKYCVAISKSIIAENDGHMDEDEEGDTKTQPNSILSKIKPKEKKNYILKEQYFLTPINYDIIKEYYLTTNPVSMNMYAENLAHAMMKMFKDSSIKYITYAGVFLVFAAIAYVIITQNPDLVSQANAVVGQ